MGGRRRAPAVEAGRYECREPPCIHLVVDRRRRIFKLFVEDYEVIAPLRVETLREACRRLGELSSLLQQGYREAEGEEVDYLARRYLEAEPYSEEVEEAG